MSLTLESIIFDLNPYFALAPLSFTSVFILYKFAMLLDVYIYRPLRKKRCPLLPVGTDVHIWQHIHQRLDPLSVIILAYLSNT